MLEVEETEEDSEFKREAADEEDEAGESGARTGRAKEPAEARTLVCSRHARCCWSQSRAT